MYAPTTQIKRNRNRRDDYGKSICVSIPFHKLDREEQMDEIVELEGWDRRSQMLLALVLLCTLTRVQLEWMEQVVQDLVDK